MRLGKRDRVQCDLVDGVTKHGEPVDHSKKWKKTQRSGTEFGHVHQIEATSKLSFGSILTQKLTPKAEIYAVVTAVNAEHIRSWLLPAVLNWGT